MSDNQKQRFSGSEVDIDWDKRLCIHVAECVRAKGELFVNGRDPWAAPDLVSVDEVVDVVHRCPSGALSYERKGQDIKERPDTENSVSVAYNGPYFVRGDLELENAPGDMPAIAFRMALCRCGQSKNKPFCDNSHEGATFQDSGAIGEKGENLSERGGKLSIKPLKDGPILLSGNITLRSGSGQVAWTGTQAALCRCGASENKPFCDGSHRKVGFVSSD